MSRLIDYQIVTEIREDKRGQMSDDYDKMRVLVLERSLRNLQKKLEEVKAALQQETKLSLHLQERAEKAEAEERRNYEHVARTSAREAVGFAVALQRLRDWIPTGVAWGQGGEAAKILDEIDRLVAEAEKPAAEPEDGMCYDEEHKGDNVLTFFRDLMFTRPQGEVSDESFLLATMEAMDELCRRALEEK